MMQGLGAMPMKEMADKAKEKKFGKKKRKSNFLMGMKKGMDKKY